MISAASRISPTGAYLMHYIAVAFTIALIATTYYAAASLVGHYWALLAALLTAFSPSILGYGSSGVGAVFRALIIFTAINALTYFLSKQTRKNLILAGISLGLTLASNTDFILLIPFYTSVFLFALMGSIGRDWNEIDPTLRANHFRVRAVRYAESLLGVFGVAIATLYLIFAAANINQTQTAPNINPNSVITEWLSDNWALRPFGTYASGLELAQQNIKPSYLKSLIFHEPLPLLIILSFALILGLLNLIKSTWGWVTKKVFVADYLGVHLQEFIYLLFIGIFGISFVLGGGDTLKLALLPPAIILTTDAVKKWFTFWGEDAPRNLILKIMIFADSAVALSLKTAALAAILIWYVIATLLAYPEFLNYTNILAKFY